MSYTKRTDIAAGPGETVVQLDTGDLVAVSCTRKRVPAGVAYHAKARAIDENGQPITTADGRPVVTELKHSVTAARVDELGDEAITRECLLAVLGEPVTGLFAWADILLSDASIRISLQAAQVSGHADVTAVL
jgi:hypothetical protein